jgi:DNA-binding YbaB/EbfC family protein
MSNQFDDDPDGIPGGGLPGDLFADDGLPGDGLPGGFDLGGMLEQVQALQQQMTEAQEAQAAKVITGSAGGGKVTVEVTGGGEFRNVSIDPEVVDATDVEMLEDLVLAAVRDAMAQVSEGYEQAVGGVDLPDLGNLGGLGDLGGLGGLLGGE